MADTSKEWHYLPYRARTDTRLVFSKHDVPKVAAILVEVPRLNKGQESGTHL